MSSLAPIGRYEIVGTIGRGGMGEVYLALDPKLDRQVAIKVLTGDNADLRERFAREGKSAARLRHANIVTVFDVGEHEGRPFIAMEYVQGETLADLIDRRADLSIDRRLALMEELCEGLGFAHKAGIIHRDIKPSNLKVDTEGSLKILDFGIARSTDATVMTQAGMLIGTVNYMSPEQVSAKPVDHRSDIFAVGAVFYELLSYEQAFPGPILDAMQKIARDPPEPLHRLCPGVDRATLGIIDRALEKDPARRYKTLAAMRNDIQQARTRIGSGESTIQYVKPAIDPPVDPPRTGPVRRPGRSAVLSAGAAVILIGGYFVVSSLSQPVSGGPGPGGGSPPIPGPAPSSSPTISSTTSTTSAPVPPVEPPRPTTVPAIAPGGRRGSSPNPSTDVTRKPAGEEEPASPTAFSRMQAQSLAAARTAAEQALKSCSPAEIQSAIARINKLSADMIDRPLENLRDDLTVRKLTVTNRPCTPAR